MHDIEWLTFGNKAELAHRAANAVAHVVERALQARGRAALALPGGATPLPAFRILADHDLRWSDVVLIPTDERLVSDDDPLSNVAAIRTYLGWTGATVVPLYDGRGGDMKAASDVADQRLRALSWPLDLVWLGMGEDGHTASILPGPDFETALHDARRAVGVVPDPLPREAPVPRLTLTRTALAETRTLVLTITGEKKRQVAEQAIEEGALSSTAIGSVLAAYRGSVAIFWSRS